MPRSRRRPTPGSPSCASFRSPAGSAASGAVAAVAVAAHRLLRGRGIVKGASCAVARGAGGGARPRQVTIGRDRRRGGRMTTTPTESQLGDEAARGLLARYVGEVH